MDKFFKKMKMLVILYEYTEEGKIPKTLYGQLLLIISLSLLFFVLMPIVALTIYYNLLKRI